jgi:hypothetical protein
MGAPYMNKASEVAAPYIEKGVQFYGETRGKAEPIMKNIWDTTVEVGSNSYEAAKPTVEKVLTFLLLCIKYVD